MSKEMTQKTNGNGKVQKPRDLRMLTPRADIYENEDEYLVVTDLPGVDRDDVTVELHDGRLVIETPEAKNGRCYHRTFSVPETMTSEGIVAKFENGVLNVHLPKPAEQKPVRIAIS